MQSYKEFIKNNQQYAKPVYWPDFVEALKRNYKTHDQTGDLKKTIIDELNIGFLLDKMDLEAEIAGEKIKFISPIVGTFEGLLLTPKKSNGCAIIGLHGHSQECNEFSNKYFIRDLVKEGFTVLIPTLRCMGLGEEEAEITRELAENGFTLMGLRVYETLLLTKYLKGFKVGLMGHSGGAEVAYLTSIINDDVKVLAFDMYPKPYSTVGSRIHCQTIPGLDRYNDQLCAFKFKIPYKKFEYRYPSREVIDFLWKNLKK